MALHQEHGVRTRALRLLAWAPSAILAAGTIALVAVLALGTQGSSSVAAPPGGKLLNPAAWGNDHVGQPIPEYMESGECLFCHRDQVGGTWQTNKHNRTIRDAEAGEPAMQALRADPNAKHLADEVQLILGDGRAQKFLKRSAAYGKLDMLSVGAAFGRGRRAKIDASEKPHWDAEAMALQCAGCHTTAVDPRTHAFATVSVDCYACHGDAPEEHTDNPKLMPLAKARQDSPAAVTSICASCHIRFGKSKSTGLPYPTNFVAGDNLFKDFQVDFAQTENAELNPADRHVMENVRDVVLHGRETMTCLNCHDVHNGSSKRHRDLASEQYCNLCHDAARPIKGNKAYEVHSERCRY
jgi:hypothetical protein